MSMRQEIPPGTLEMLILQTLSTGPDQHGFEIAEAIQDTSAGVFVVEEGSLYPALQRLLVKGWLTAEWSKTPEKRRARYYRLTPAGREQLKLEVDRYQKVAGAIARILQPA